MAADILTLTAFYRDINHTVPTRSLVKAGIPDRAALAAAEQATSFSPADWRMKANLRLAAARKANAPRPNNVTPTTLEQAAARA